MLSKQFEDEGSLNLYIAKIKNLPMLSAEEELQLATKWRAEGDRQAIDKLVSSHLRLVAKVAAGYRGYGLPLSDLIAEGNIGVLQAIKHYDPTRGFRFSTYALWWIKANIQDYILRTWSLVKMGTTAAQKRLFFKLRQTQRTAASTENNLELTPEVVTQIAHKLCVKEEEVLEMNYRLSGKDHSLNAPMREDPSSESEWMEWLVDERDNQEVVLAQQDEMNKRRQLLDMAMETLTSREKLILIDRRLTEPPLTLEALSEKYSISRERVRQIEFRALEKLQSAIKKLIEPNYHNV